MAKEYSEDDIQAIPWREAVRLRPKLYFLECFETKSLDSLPLEVACHAIDEIIDDNCTTLKFTLFEDYFSLDYDAGMLKAESIMTQMFSCRNTKKHLSVGEKFCKLGIATINAIAEYCEVTTVVNSEKNILKFHLGETKESEVISEYKGKEFTQIMMKPSYDIFEGFSFNYEGIKAKVEELNQEFPNVNISIAKGNL